MAKFMTSSVLFITYYSVIFGVGAYSDGKGFSDRIIPRRKARYMSRSLYPGHYQKIDRQPSTKIINHLASGYSGSSGSDTSRGQGVWRRGSEEINQLENTGSKIMDTVDKEEACYKGTVITCAKGTVTSLDYPESYPANIICRWLIRAPKGQVVQLNFQDLSLGEGDCVELFYRSSAIPQLYDPAEVLCGDLRPKKFTSVGHQVEVMLTADGASEGRGMLFHYNFRGPVPCDDIIELQGISGSLSSPDYPQHYQAHNNCTWRIITPSNTRVGINFRDLAVEYARSCEYDALTLYDGSTTSETKLATRCGHDLPDDVTSSTNVVLLVFTSDISSEDRGFDLEWTAIGT
ncbi:hypothetical protein LSH36_704g02003 [Paralvinella palmiformis]|uniref:CUB domain-containing protein n=1 Tax=Paralvinella palmiformis TaxID=53620 RepID=A0AAD9J2X3_9ANNE|nr:hypothetical protein LSH36_704g02003 [Paralvinella palmiformis]